MPEAKVAAPGFASRLLAWYARNARSLPWRGSSDPYRVWISEVMLQQTRVETVIPYYERWERAFPTLEDLALASERDVLRLWEGLGYYSRARNLLKSAKVVMKDFGGQLPSRTSDLRKLPGIGPYTAGAISSIAFGLREPALDGNIRRVLARVFNVTKPADSAAGQGVLWGLAAAQLPKSRVGDYNQALMDLGALICLPKEPKCVECPLAKMCQAYRRGIQSKLPVVRRRKPTPHYQLAAVVIRTGGRVLLAQRSSRGLLGGMWEFPNAPVSGAGPHRSPIARGFSGTLKHAYGLKVVRKANLGEIRHAYSHFRVTVQAVECKLLSVSGTRQLRWIAIAALPNYPMGKVDREIARKLGP